MQAFFRKSQKLFRITGNLWNFPYKYGMITVSIPFYPLKAEKGMRTSRKKDGVKMKMTFVKNFPGMGECDAYVLCPGCAKKHIPEAAALLDKVDEKRFSGTRHPGKTSAAALQTRKHKELQYTLRPIYEV